MDRKYTRFNGTEIIEQGTRDVDWEEVRRQRDQALSDSDWWALKDLTMSQAKKDYRQALRDLPQVHEHANDAIDNWPEIPE
ncbi:MAG: hypothetical protein CL398_12875 [Acidiferrobacteraceae bacterium]|nr:hypothetical protein [Acidiferrobacteraceae bacterium]|tara:strand:+ start:2311 stop:2553 length:243 start_codon:yes stop_codon:yes gene_type:complete